MHELTREGYLERTRGRGTFVADSKLVEKISIVGSFHSSIARQGLRLTLSVITNDIVAAPAEVSEALALPSAKAWYLRRLAIVEGEPVALLDAWLPKELARGVKQLDLGERSLYEALADVHRLEMTTAENLVEVQRASTEEASLLELPPGSQLLRVSGVTRDRARDPVEFADVRYRPDRFKIAVESAAAPPSRPQRRS
jgi:GntR family transcriptional regulator